MMASLQQTDSTPVKNRTFLHEELLRGPFHRLAKDITVTIAGCGALGSWTALFLANSGIKKFRLIDRDKVEEHNLSTQFFAKWNLGQTKVQALATELYRRHGCRIEKHPVNLTEKNAKALLKNSSIVICTFDNKASREIVKETCFRLSNKTQCYEGSINTNPVPCLIAGMHGKEYYGHVDWAENFIIPNDPPEVNFDPCNYPLTITLAVWVSSAITEIAIKFLITGIKQKMTETMLANIHDV